MTAVLAAVGVATLVAGSIVMGTAGTVQADESVPCGTPAQEAVYQTIQHAAVPAVYETVVLTPAAEAWVEVVPAVTEQRLVSEAVYEYRFTHVQDGDGDGEDGNGNGQGEGPADKWVDSLDWNAESNPESTGWVYTGEKRVVTAAVYETHVLVPEKRIEHPAQAAVTEQKLVTPAVPAGPPCEDDETPPPPVKDVCTNINGVQPDVPKGYTEQDGICTEIEVLPTESTDVCSNIKGAQAAVPAGLEAQDGKCVKPAEEKPDEVVGPDEVLGTAEAVPTAVDAGIGVPTVTTASTSSPLGQRLVGAGVVMLLLAGAMQMGRARGAHQV